MTAKQNSIGNKLMKGMLLTTGTVLLLTFSSYFLYEIYSDREIATRELQIIASVIAYNSTAALAFESDEEGNEILSSLSAQRFITQAALYDNKGNLFVYYPDTLVSEELPAEVPEPGFQFSGRSLIGSVPVVFDDKLLGTLYIRRSLADDYTRFGLYVLMAGVIVSAGFFIAFLLSTRIQKQLATPIISLAEASMLVTQRRDYSIRARKFDDDEVGVLTDAFNKMLSQIQKQNEELEIARRADQRNAQELEVQVAQRTLEFKRQKEFAEVVIDSSLALIAVLDTELKFIAFNRNCEQEFKITRERALGRGYVDVLPSSQNSLTHKSLVRALKGEVVHNHQYKSPVTGSYYESYTIPLLNEDGNVYAVLMTAHNITQIVESSEQIRTTNIELQRRNAALEQFAYVASHDLQEPLRKIQVFMEMLRNNLGDREVALRYMQKIENSASRMASLIKAVLDYSRLQGTEQGFAETNLNEILENVMSDFELLINQKGAVIRNNELPFIKANALQIHQLFSNLISNSIKFCDSVPQITITGRLFTADHESPGLISGVQYAELVFSDNGIGFDNKYADKIFTIFQRLNSRDRYDGTGIGLALCKKIVDNHNGSISVDSAPGKGTTFNVILPV